MPPRYCAFIIQVKSRINRKSLWIEKYQVVKVQIACEPAAVSV